MALCPLPQAIKNGIGSEQNIRPMGLSFLRKHDHIIRADRHRGRRVLLETAVPGGC